MHVHIYALNFLSLVMYYVYIFCCVAASKNLIVLCRIYDNQTLLTSVEVDEGCWRHFDLPKPSKQVEALACLLGHWFDVAIPGQIAICDIYFSKN